MAGCATDQGKQALALHYFIRLRPARGRWVIEQVPFHHVQIALADFLTVAVAIWIILTDPGWAAHAAAIFAGFVDELLGSGIRYLGQSVAMHACQRGRITGLQASMNVKRRSSKRPQRGRDGRPKWQIKV